MGTVILVHETYTNHANHPVIPELISRAGLSADLLTNRQEAETSALLLHY